VLRLVHGPEAWSTPLTAAWVPCPRLKWVKNGFVMTGEFAGMKWAMPGQFGLVDPAGIEVFAGSLFWPHQKRISLLMGSERSAALE
jgi:hypothetical protein